MIRYIGAVAIVGLLAIPGQASAKSHFSTEGQRICDDRYALTCDVRGYEQPAPVKGRRLHDDDQRILPHPAGCPARAFCGCGVSVRVFGHPVRDLFLARAWGRFPPTHLAPGTVAYRNHHVVYVEDVRSDGRAIVFDPNSGRHQTRIHARDLAGFRVVDPRRV
jgi:hypothetical protein